jgi:Derlin-2/3
MTLYCLNQVLSVIPQLNTYVLGLPMVSMLVYVWSRENPNAQINIYGILQLKVCSFTNN